MTTSIARVVGRLGTDRRPLRVLCLRQALRRALTLDLGRYLREVRDPGAAVEVLTRYVGEHPRGAEGWHEPGRATQFTYENADRRERAMAHYRRALAENPDVITRHAIERFIQTFEDAGAGVQGEE